MGDFSWADMHNNVNTVCLLSAGTIIIFMYIAYDYYLNFIHLKFITFSLALISFNIW